GQRADSLTSTHRPRREQFSAKNAIISGTWHAYFGESEKDNPMVASSPLKLDRERIRVLTDREEDRLNERTGWSSQMYERAKKSMVNGVPSSYQVRDPWPIYLREGRGSKVWDVEGNELIDFHNGLGSMVQGDAHPAIVR